MKLLQIPTANLEERIKEEMEANPALEEGIDEDEMPTVNDSEDDMSSDTQTDETPTEETEVNQEDEELEESSQEETDFAEEDSKDAEDSAADNDTDLSDYMNDEDEIADYKLATERDPDTEMTKGVPVAMSRSFHEYLEEQVLMLDLDERQTQLAQYIVGSIDADGYLRRPLDAMVDDIAFSLNIETTVKELEELLKQIQQLEPAGVGARDLKECLLLQIQRIKEHPVINKIATDVVVNHFDEFVKKHYEKLQKQLEVQDDTFKMVMETILKLNPKPGSAYQGNSTAEYFLLPDFYLTNNDGKLEVTLNGMNVPDLRISSNFKEMLKEYSSGAKKDKKQKEAFMFIKQKIDSAKWFIDAIRQRQNTLLLTMNAIVDYQREYFLTGDDTKLKPMILKDIADRVGMDISTISRVANSKYIQTEFGTFKLKSFFSESLSTDSGDEVSTREVKKILTDLIAAENKKKPLSDQKLTKLLNEKGYNIARRTVAKYREQLDIPVARLRKEI
jgi:RNA polymerase sigma-54 factor